MNGQSRKHWILLFVALALVLGGSGLAAMINSDWGRVAVKDVRFVGSGGDVLRALLYVPHGVTKQNPAPAVMVIGGGDSTSDQFSSLSVEFARRGYVVFNFDKRGEGYSEGIGNQSAIGYGGPEAFAYLRTLDIVDPERISMIGHSQGGSAITNAALMYPEGYLSMFVIGSTTPVVDAKADPSGLRNVGYICGTDDRCRYDPAPVQRLLGVDDLYALKHGDTIGSIADGTGRVMYYVPVQHNLQSYWPEAMGYIVDWIQRTNPAPKNILASDQVFLFKYVGTTVSLVGVILFLFPLGALLLQTSFFKPLVGPVPQFRGSKGRAWWIGAVLTALVPVVSLFQLHALGLKAIPASWFFPMSRISGLLFWALCNGAFTVAVIAVNRFVFKADAGATGVNYGLTWPEKGLDWGKIGKSVLLAVTVVGAAYVLVCAIYSWLTVDFRIWTVFLRPMNPQRFWIALRYAIPFGLFTLAFAAGLHGLLRPKGGTMTLGREMIVNCAVVAPWFLLLQLAYYGPFLFGFKGVPFSGGQMRHFITSLPAVMTVVACVSTYFYHKTGRVYVGAVMNALLLGWYLVCGNLLNVVG